MTAERSVTGPLRGVRIVEFAGLGPGPFAAMMLGDLGAEIVRIDRPPGKQGLGAPSSTPHPVQRGRRSICIDLTRPEGADLALKLIGEADALIEGLRPGKMEKLGLGPDLCLQVNPRLVYGRMTGWGQTGPYAQRAGHDINYIATAGVLGLIGRRDAPPTVPLNLVGDYGGGGMLLAFGLVSALFEAKGSGRGQVIDAAMIDGAASLITSFHHMKAIGRWNPARGTNHLDSGAPYYNVYETADGGWVSIGAIEPEFYRLLLNKLGLSGEFWDSQSDRSLWPARTEALARIFRTRTRQAWCDHFGDEDVCFAPVLGLDELVDDPHNKAREAFAVRDGVVYPAPAPRFSRTPAQLGAKATAPGAATDALLSEIGLAVEDIERLRAAGVIAGPAHVEMDGAVASAED